MLHGAQGTQCRFISYTARIIWVNSMYSIISFDSVILFRKFFSKYTRIIKYLNNRTHIIHILCMCETHGMYSCTYVLYNVPTHHTPNLLSDLGRIGLNNVFVKHCVRFFMGLLSKFD